MATNQATKPSKRLTLKQQRFITAYIANGGNGLQAAKTAGYMGADNILASIASQNLTKDYIKKYIDEWVDRCPDTLAAQEVLQQLTHMALSSKTPAASRVKALELLGRYHAMWIDKTQTEQNINVDYSAAVNEINSAINRNTTESPESES